MEESERIYITVTQLTLTVNIGITIKEYPPFAFTLWKTSNHLSLSCPISFSFFLFPSNLSENSRSGVSKQEKQLVKSKFLLSCKKNSKTKYLSLSSEALVSAKAKPLNILPSSQSNYGCVYLPSPPPKSIHTKKWIQTF